MHPDPSAGAAERGVRRRPAGGEQSTSDAPDSRQATPAKHTFQWGLEVCPGVADCYAMVLTS